MAQKYDIAAYVWPSYSGNDPRTRTFWPEGMGEWQTVRDAKPKFPGHVEPRKPLWGYVNEANPDVMQMQIDVAARHGVNVFIYDWYWYDNRPFLEDCLNDGFLGAPNNRQMQFYIMWANHDATHLWDKRNTHDVNGAVLWEGFADRAKFETACRRVIDKYFHRSNYYRLGGEPVFSVFDIANLVKGLGGVRETREALTWFRAQSAAAGHGGVHMQAVLFGVHEIALPEGGRMLNTELAVALGFSSTTNYQFCSMTNIKRDYADIMKDIPGVWEKYAGMSIPYVPHVSVGWDNNARFYGFNEDLITGNTPEQVERAFREAKAFLDAKPGLPKLVTVNSWNEWTEGSYLQPDALYGYGYLEAIRRVFQE